MKRRIAIWMMGGVGGGYFSQGIPAISAVVQELAGKYDITVFSLFPANSNFRPKGFQFVTVRRRSWLRLTLRFISEWRKNRFDVLYAYWGFPAGLIIVVLGKLFKTPTVIHLQGGDSVYIPSIAYGVFGNIISKRLALWSYRNCSRLIALTQFQLNSLNQSGFRGVAEIIPFGVDRKLFVHHEKSSHKDRELRILHIGNVSPVKDHETLIKTFAAIRSVMPAKLRMIGLDMTNEQINLLCVQYGIQNDVELSETQPHIELPDAFAWADVFLLTSLYEGQGVVLSEAAASGCIVAGTNVGLLHDWGNQCAIVVKVGDSAKLASEVIKIENDQFRMNAHREGLKSWSEQHDFNWTIKKISNVIESLP